MKENRIKEYLNDGRRSVYGPHLRRPHAIVESTRPTATFPIPDRHAMASTARINSMIRHEAPSTRLTTLRAAALACLSEPPIFSLYL
jgi:hypothetical protein